VLSWYTARLGAGLEWTTSNSLWKAPTAVEPKLATIVAIELAWTPRGIFSDA